MSEPVFVSGAGNAAEALMDVNPTIVIPPKGVFQLINFIATYEGAGYIRFRESDLNGAELLRIRIAADGTIIGDFRTAPYTLNGGAAGRTVVVTQEGDFACSLTMSCG